MTLPPHTDACALLSTAEVTALLGVAPQLPPASHSPFPDIQVACGWTGTGAEGQRAQLVVTVTARARSYDSTLAKQPGAVPVSGIGDKATFLPPGTIGAVRSGIFSRLDIRGFATGAPIEQMLRRDVLTVLHRMGR